MGRYYEDDSETPDAWIAISKARHWDMAEAEFQLDLHMASLNLLTGGQQPKKLEMREEDEQLEEV